VTTVRQLERRMAAASGGDLVPKAPTGTTTLAVLGGAALSIVGLAVSMEFTSYDIWGAFWIGPLLMLACLPVARLAARAEGDERLVRWFMGAALLKVIVGPLTRYLTVDIAYGGTADSRRYDDAGAMLAPAFRRLDYQDLGEISGTRFIEVLTGQVYALTGATRLGGFFVFSFLAFLGMVAFHRAFTLGFPEGNARRHRLLLFLFPTMWFWPSSIGKDTWMVVCLGFAAYGLACTFHGRLRGLPIMALALWGAGIVRPHVVLIFLVGVAVALLVRYLPVSNPGPAASGFRRSAAAVLLTVLVAAATVAAGAAFEERFGLDRLDVVSAEEVLDETARRSAQGGSEFEAPNPSNLVGYVAAFVTVLYRPFLFEVSGVTALLSALEGTALLALTALAARRLIRVPGLVLRRAYVAFAAFYLLGFVYAFASVENFGILARQRTQVLPLLFVLLAVAHRRSTRRRPGDAQLASV
jgi:hypothetical protein